MKEYIVVSNAPEMDFRKDYVALPSDYGTDSYFSRPDIKAIYQLVFENLNRLNEKNGFADKLGDYTKILIKPNLVSVYHNCGMEQSDYPESTDPRVFDAVISYLKQYQSNITIVESSGISKPMA